ncbi:MAG: hypothetical protein GWN71_35535, partial [Gammaproteobacteria bacterium]|nr:hypothetical protein [Gemmatimonadota bacterium]NIU78677.1 hypothetical protein [Gammaproteobacteria bacterium]NIY11881.1 hypothetical protein [Gemmatimonadota bacterium]
QVGKYIPGGVWVGAGQVGFGMGAGLSAGRATGALATYGVCLVAAAGVVVALGAVAGTAGPPTPWLSALGLALPLLLVRGRLAGLAAWLGKRLPARVGGIDVPPQRAILSCFAWLVPAMACSALAFALLLRAAGTGIPAATALWGFAVAWLAGFLALGLPSGVGAREAVLVLLLDTGIGPVVTASVAHRLVQALAEALLLASVHRHVPGAARSS